MIKLTILINFLLLVISLFSSLFIVYKEKGTGDKSFYSLVIRVGLAILLLLQIGFGLATGQIGSRAPWDQFDAPNAPPVKPPRESKAPIIHDPVKEQALKEARESLIKAENARNQPE